MSRGTFLLTVSFLLAAFSLSGCSSCFGRHEDGASITIERVQFRTASPTVTVVGEIIPSNKAVIDHPSPVKVDEVLVTTGQDVSEGDALLKLSDEPFLTQITPLRAELKEAEAIAEKNRFLLKNRDTLREEGKLDETQYAGLPAEINVNEATVEKLKATIAAVEFNLSRLTIPSPLSGIVMDVAVAAGQSIPANTPMISVGVMDPVYVGLSISSNEAMGIGVGTPITFQLEDIPGQTLEATVSMISPALHTTDRAFDVWASIPNPDMTLKAGMKVSANFTSTAQHQEAVIPLSALMSDDNSYAVYKVVNGVARRSPVTVKERTSKEAILSDGVASDDLIIIDNVRHVHDGMIVDIRR